MLSFVNPANGTQIYTPASGEHNFGYLNQQDTPKFSLRSSNGKVYPLVFPENTIGKKETNHITIDDHTVNQHHAVIELDQSRQRPVLKDRNSINGTFVNGMRVQTADEDDDQGRPLFNGDELKFGDNNTRFTFVCQQDQELLGGNNLAGSGYGSVGFGSPVDQLYGRKQKQ